MSDVRISQRGERIFDFVKSDNDDFKVALLDWLRRSEEERARAGEFSGVYHFRIGVAGNWEWIEYEGPTVGSKLTALAAGFRAGWRTSRVDLSPDLRLAATSVAFERKYEEEYGDSMTTHYESDISKLEKLQERLEREAELWLGI